MSYMSRVRNMWCLLLLVVIWSSSITALPQRRISQVDGFVFNGPISAGNSNGSQRTTSTTTSTTTEFTTTSTVTEPTTISTTTESTNSITTPLSDEYFTCIGICTATNEYNPVCGTDNVDYNNPGQLGCAQRCGKDITLNYYGKCSTRSG